MTGRWEPASSSSTTTPDSARRRAGYWRARATGSSARRATARPVEAARGLGPELALVDVHLPDGDGFELASRLKLLVDAPVVVLISSRYGAEIEPCIFECGARGFVPKAELSRAAIEEQLR